MLVPPMNAGHSRSGPVEGVAINGPAANLGSRHVILWARGREHHVRDFAGPLSIKSVVRGSADWRTEDGRFAIDHASYLVVNEAQPYSLDIESLEPVETFCVFFRRGFVEEARAVLAGREDLLLDEPGLEMRDTTGFETYRARDRGVMSLLKETHLHLSRGRPPGAWIEDRMAGLAGALLRAQTEVRREMARIPAARPATRAEIYRRLRRALDFVEGSLAQPVDLNAMARAACLSPYHFHRRFSEAFRETPHEYVRRRRLEIARDLLVKSALPVTVVCHRSGFESLGSFSALFRRSYGLPPLTYRRASAPNRNNGEKLRVSSWEDGAREDST
jgi:AraC-like DNA-binding protein